MFVPCHPTHLRRLPISFLKIDRSFVAGLEVELHGLGLRSIAEGVETLRAAGDAPTHGL